MPLYIPWLTETIKKRGVRYLLHHYLGQFFEEKLTLDQLSIDIYEGKGSISNLGLDVDGLNDELDFIPFRFLDGCTIGQISVEVPWSSLATEACKVELDGAKFVCRLKTSADGARPHCTESTLLSRSLMTSSMQMAEDIVTTENNEDQDSPVSSAYKPDHGHNPMNSKKKDANQMFEGLEMFAQLIDSVLRRTKLTARNTLFRIQSHTERQTVDDSGGEATSSDWNRSSTGDGISESSGEKSNPEDSNHVGSSEETVEFMIKFFRCEEILDQMRTELSSRSGDNDFQRAPFNVIPETVTKLLTLEDVEMRIGGVPVSNLVGKHTIMIKFNGHKSEISIYSGSPLLAVISHEQLKTFFNVFDSVKERDCDSSPNSDKNQKVMSSEDYAKIESQLLESAFSKTVQQVQINDICRNDQNNLSNLSGRRWIDCGNTYSGRQEEEQEYNYHPPNFPSHTSSMDNRVSEAEPSLHNIEAFSCELKLPGIWLCILKDGEPLPPLIKPYADSINSFQTINKYIDDNIEFPHLRLLALKVALEITTGGMNVYVGDLDVSEHLQNESMSPILHILRSDWTDTPTDSSRYHASISNDGEINIDLLTKSRMLLDPTMIDRIVHDYKLVNFNRLKKEATSQRNNQIDLKVRIRGELFTVELLCPIPDLTDEGRMKATQTRPQSFLFDFKSIILSWYAGKLNVSCLELTAFVKTQPQQSDNEAVEFIQTSNKKNERIVLTLEPSPSNLDDVFPNDVEQALNESSMYDSIYVSQTAEGRVLTEAFQTKRKVVRTSTEGQANCKRDSEKLSDCDNEKIITPGDRQHLLEYLNQTVMSTKLSLTLHIPICEIEFEDKEQLDLIYNRFGNDFVFWRPKAFTSNNNLDTNHPDDVERYQRDGAHSDTYSDRKGVPLFKQATREISSSSDLSECDSEVSFHSLSIEGSCPEMQHDNEVTCKITVDELYVKFNHQSCAAAMKQEISVDSLLFGVVIDVSRKPGTIISLVANNLQLSTDEETVLEGNCFGDLNSIFSLTAEIKRPTKTLKEIKLAIQLRNGLFDDFATETFTRFWQSVNVTDEPILGYIAPRILTELHIDILDTALSLVREGARPALLSVDELYLTSMVMEQTSQVMIRLIADEASLYLKRNKQGLDVLKNYVCLIDSGLIDLDVKFSQDGRLEFGVINNVITIRACQDSLSALCKLFNVMMRNSSQKSENNQHQYQTTTVDAADHDQTKSSSDSESTCHSGPDNSDGSTALSVEGFQRSKSSGANGLDRRESKLLEDAMNDYCKDSPAHEMFEPENGGAPPVIQTTIERHRNPNACILDESNPMIEDFFSQPLLPSSGRMYDSSESFNSTNKAIDESGFFVIGDDDVGAGIIDKQQLEPVVRKLIDGPLTIIDNHFKMTKPRTIPEMLASSLERYMLEEMTLVVNLFGGRDFDEESPVEDQTSTNTISDDYDSEQLDAISLGSDPIRSRAGSVTSVKKCSTNRRHCLSDSSGSQKRRGGRRKYQSEGSKDQQQRGQTGAEQRVRFGEGAVNLWESLDLMSSPDFLSSASKSDKPALSLDTRIAGGTLRQTDVCIQLNLTKVKMLYEIGGLESPISWRFMLFIQDIEIKDQIHASDINKMLYEYCTESMPKRNTQILTVKNVATINPSDGCEECDLRVSLKPLRLNIDQDTLLFLIEFFSAFSKSLAKQQSVYGEVVRGSSCKLDPRSSAQKDQSPTVVPSAKADSSGSSGEMQGKQKAAKSHGIEIRKRHSSERSDTSLSFGSCSSTASYFACPRRVDSSTPPASNQTGTESSAPTSTTVTVQLEGENGPTGLPTHCHTDSVSDSASQHSIYIKSFTFSPDVPIRLDYHAKHLDFEQGALAGILMGLAHLDHSELVLRRVQAKHGMRGLDRVLLFTLNSWLSDIKRNQLPSILGGVGPLHSVIQLFQGMRDLIWMPIDHYRKDRRLVRGLQRGASSFSSSTAMAAINLINRFISIVQCTAQIAHDIVTPPALQSSSSRRDSYKSRQTLSQGLQASSGSNQRRRLPSSTLASSSVSTINQPRNFCEGVAVGFNILKEGFNDTARNVAVGMQAEDVRSAVGELVRQIPSTFLNPIISATEGAQNVLVGIRNQIAPDARREDQEKWKRRVRGK